MYSRSRVVSRQAGVTARRGVYHSHASGSWAAALDGAPGNVRRDANSSSVAPTPAGGERHLHACFPKSGYVTPNPTHVVSVPCLDASRRKTPAAMATIERINSSSSLLAGMTLSATQDPARRGPSVHRKENREQATQRLLNKNPRTCAQWPTWFKFQAQAGTVVWLGS